MKIIQGALFATAAGALTFGAAASLNLSADDLGSGSAPVQSCDTDGVRVAWNTETPAEQTLNLATLTELAPRCVGQQVQVQVFDDLGTMLGWGIGEVYDNGFGPEALVSIGSLGGQRPIPLSAVASTSVTITGEVLTS